MTEKELTAISIAIGVLKRESMFENAEILKGLRTRLSLAAGASEGQEPIYQVGPHEGKWVDVPEHAFNVAPDALRRIVYAHPSAEIAALRERLNAAASLNAVYAQDITDLRNGIAGMEKDAREILRLATCDAANSVNAPALLKKVAEIVAKEPK